MGRFQAQQIHTMEFFLVTKDFKKFDRRGSNFS